METQDAGITISSRKDGKTPLKDSSGRWQLQAETDWIIQGPTNMLDAIAKALASRRLCERLGNVLLLRFGNAVGFLDLPHLGRVHIESGKWTGEDFDRMLADLIKVATGLPFSADKATALPYDRSVAANENVLYHTFIYLRYILSKIAPPQEQLLPALHLILREPHRVLERTTQRVPIELAHRADTTGLLSLIINPQLAPVSAETRARIPLAGLLKDHLPTHVQQRETHFAYDTPENRFTKTFLQSTVGIARRMRERAKTDLHSGPFLQDILSDCDQIERALTPIAQHSLWMQVGPMVHLPAASTVLQHRRGYRETFQAFTRLRLAARVPLDTSVVRKLLETKDIALLYELWAFFQTAHAITEILGTPLSAEGPSTSDFQVSVPRDLTITWDDGTRLLYNARFSRGTDGGKSYSVTLRPDIALYVKQGNCPGLHLLDAKFRLDQESLNAILPATGTPDEDPAEDERRGSFKRADLYKMHTYRDAIIGTRSVWILYPGSETRFFTTTGNKISDLSQLPKDTEGIGAIPLLPGKTSQLQAALRQLLR